MLNWGPAKNSGKLILLKGIHVIIGNVFRHAIKRTCIQKDSIQRVTFICTALYICIGGQLHCLDSLHMELQMVDVRIAVIHLCVSISVNRMRTEIQSSV